MGPGLGITGVVPGGVSMGIGVVAPGFAIALAIIIGGAPVGGVIGTLAIEAAGGILVLM